MDPLILGALSIPATTLIKKIAGAIGVLYEPTRIERKARAEAKAEEIMEINKLQIDALKKRTVHRLLNEEVRKQDNMEKIIEKALPQIQENAKADAVDDDWLVNFFEKSRSFSNDDMQIIWGKILAGETNSPGSFSRQTIKVVSDLDRKDADLFTSLASCTFTITETPTIVLFFNDDTAKIYAESNLNLFYFTHLETMGLVRFEGYTGFQMRKIPKQITISYFGSSIKMEFVQDNNALNIGHILLTQAGLELISICGAKPNNMFKGIAINHWKKDGISIFEKEPTHAH